MDVERARTHSSYMDIIDRVLDKGIVIDGWMGLSVGGIDLITIEAHLVVASIDTHVTHLRQNGEIAQARHRVR